MYYVLRYLCMIHTASVDVSNLHEPRNQNYSAETLNRLENILNQYPVTPLWILSKDTDTSASLHHLRPLKIAHGAERLKVSVQFLYESPEPLKWLALESVQHLSS